MKYSDAILLSVLIIYLFVAIIAARKFDEIAKMKGHSGYFWWCFWLGVIGWTMVIALPDRGSGSSPSPNAPKGQREPEPEEQLPEL